MTNVIHQKINKLFVGACTMSVLAVVFILGTTTVHAQYDDYSSYSGGSDYSSYSSGSDYSSYSSGSDYSAYSPSYDSSSYSTYSPSDSSGYSTYSPSYSSSYSTYSPSYSSDYSAYSAGNTSNYSTYSPSDTSNYSTYSPSDTSNYSSYSPSYTSDYSTYSPSNTSDYSSYTANNTSDYSSYTQNNTSDYSSYTPNYSTSDYSSYTPNYSTSDYSSYTPTYAGNYGTYGNSGYGSSGCGSGCGGSTYQPVAYGYNSGSTYHPAPVYSAPVYQAPVYNAPVYHAPTYNAPVYNAPTYNAPTYSAPTYVAPIVYSNPVVYNYNPLTVYCSANQTSAYSGEAVTWSAVASGGTGNYSYAWSGTDRLFGYNQYSYHMYSYPGTKYAYVTVSSNGQSITSSCSTYVNASYSPVAVAYTNPTSYNGVSLAQVPYTGLDSNMKVILFTIALVVWSAIVTYVVILRKRNKNVGEMVPAVANNTISINPVASTADEKQQVARQDALMSFDRFITDLGSYAQSNNVIISTDALHSIANVADGSVRKAKSLINSLASRFSTGEEYTAIDLEKVKSVIV